MANGVDNFTITVFCVLGLSLVKGQGTESRALFARSASGTFNIADPRWDNQRWYMDSGKTLDTNIAKAWSLCRTGKNVTVAVVDDGVLSTHRDLNDKIVSCNAYIYI
ncbi:neuroendocrine convertase 2-like [Lingula anatina]|uniref:Neuroendocrine convertase 2-like n=1 Tax=Lingula anatina TaxID=7574 RepID=A0A1S3JPQ6_LINAN|nr:neuroendocrine convertase 2-like [Lingula anatina]|eukprot:XP_013411959.1 neuroendocrine convertase 2-like [Lingula anatina]